MTLYYNVIFSNNNFAKKDRISLISRQFNKSNLAIKNEHRSSFLKTASSNFTYYPLKENSVSGLVPRIMLPILAYLKSLNFFHINNNKFAKSL